MDTRVRGCLLLGIALAAGGAPPARGAGTVAMPAGADFAFWDDATTYTNILHVAQAHPNASDDNPGTAERPFATIGRAAALLQPAEKVIVHAGVYRECVRPARGGEGPDRMIAYEAATGETVRVLGSEIFDQPLRPSEGWGPATTGGGATVWMLDLPPASFAATAYNPFIANNMSAEFTTFTKDWTPEETQRQQLRRGMVFVNGEPLRQVFRDGELLASNGTFWVEEPGVRLHLRLPGDADPTTVRIEITAREQVFAPAVRGLNYIRVSGFTLEHAADGVPIPQRALLSANRGHHWIMEDNRVRWANAVGIDVGRESWHAWHGVGAGSGGGHIVRRNHVSDAGICGIAGVGNVNGSLFEDNLVTHIGGLDIERMWETAGIKLHTCDGVLIRRNVIRHLRHAAGLWLDYRVTNTRVSENLFMDIAARNGGLFLEVSHGPNVVDRNVFWGIHADRPYSEKAHALNVDSGEKCTAAYNLFVDVPDGYGVAMHLAQSLREVAGRTGLSRKHAVLNNVFVRCKQRVLLERAEDNQCEGNLYDRAGDGMSFRVDYPPPRAMMNLETWQEYFGYDLRGRQAKLEAHIDPETRTVTLGLEGALPVGEPVPVLGADGARTQPGPSAWDVGDATSGAARVTWRVGPEPAP